MCLRSEPGEQYVGLWVQGSLYEAGRLGCRFRSALGLSRPRALQGRVMIRMRVARQETPRDVSVRGPLDLEGPVVLEGTVVPAGTARCPKPAR